MIRERAWRALMVLWGTAAAGVIVALLWDLTA